VQGSRVKISDNECPIWVTIWKQHGYGLLAGILWQSVWWQKSACYALRNIKYIVPLDTLKLIYFAHIHSTLNYGIIFWGNSPHSVKVFKMQKRIIRIITNSGNRDSCRKLFKKMEILPFYSQYLYTLILYMMNNKHLFKANMDVHNYETRNKTIISQSGKILQGTLLLWNKGFQLSSSWYKGIVWWHKMF
jgi:hypothetical protein